MAFDSYTYKAKARNIIVIISDDVGMEQHQRFATGEGTWYPVQANLNLLYDGGVSFTGFVTSPNCSTTRCMFLTGRHSFRTGIGGITPVEEKWYLPFSELIIPKMLDLGTGFQYEHAAFGKWHINNLTFGGTSGPNIYGFDHFSGTIDNIPPNKVGFSQRDYQKVVDGEIHFSRVYSATDQVNDALAWIDKREQPFFALLAFNLCHRPYNRPPEALYTHASYQQWVIDSGVDVFGSGVGVSVHPLPEDKGSGTSVTGSPYFKSAMESMDIEIGRLLNSMSQSTLEETMIIYCTDNGTPSSVLGGEQYPTGESYDPDHAKGTMYEPGIKNPMIVFGAGVTDTLPRTNTQLIHTVDLFDTIREVTGADAALFNPGSAIKLDGVSFNSTLTNASGTTARTDCYVETFSNDDGPNVGAVDGQKSIQNESNYKLITVTTGGIATEELYNLTADPREVSIIALPYSGADLTNYDSLKATQAALLAST